MCIKGPLKDAKEEERQVSLSVDTGSLPVTPPPSLSLYPSASCRSARHRSIAASLTPPCCIGCMRRLSPRAIDGASGANGAGLAEDGQTRMSETAAPSSVNARSQRPSFRVFAATSNTPRSLLRNSSVVAHRRSRLGRGEARPPRPPRPPFVGEAVERDWARGAAAATAEDTEDPPAKEEMVPSAPPAVNSGSTLSDTPPGDEEEKEEGEEEEEEE